MTRLMLSCLALTALLAAPAQAQDCRNDSSTSVGGTLTAPRAPCKRPTPAAGPQRKKDVDPPGTYRSGNTTIQWRGSVQMDATTRGR
ncbi:MAG: hypothetical protein IT538_05320 [Variibacter sp.]|nr:hypothetical protein [Variibacter sp.]